MIKPTVFVVVKKVFVENAQTKGWLISFLSEDKSVIGKNGAEFQLSVDNIVTAYVTIPFTKEEGEEIKIGDKFEMKYR